MLESYDAVVEEIADPEPFMHPLVLAMRELREDGIVESYHTDSLELTEITGDKEIDEEIAYHGSIDDITAFHPLTHFGTEKAAKDRMTYKKIKDGKIYKVDLDIKNPLTINDFPGIHYDRLYAFELRRLKLISQEEMEAITTIDDNQELRKALLNKLKELGIDGFVYKNRYEDKGNISYVIVDPSQVKVLSVEPATEEVTESIERVKGGWKHHGLGYRQDPITWEYPVHPLPKWHKFSSYNRSKKGTWKDIIHYMIFTINDYATYSLDLIGDEIAKTICKLHGTDTNEELKNANEFFQDEVPLSWSDIYDMLKEESIQQFAKSLQKKELTETSPDTLEGSFTPDLVESKTWLCEKLAKGLKGKNAGTIYALGSWYGNIGIFLQQAGVKFDKLVLVEPDEEALMRSKELLEPLNDDGKLILLHQNAEDIVYDKPGIIINTSCNETGPVFLTKVPKGMLCALQARNNVDDVLISTDDLQEFDELFPLEKTYYIGKKELIDPETDYTRFMKIGRAGNALSETASTGQGGGSAGNGGGQMVGGPTTYEQEYGMFKSKGPRRITAMTNEALDSSYEYDKGTLDNIYYFATEDNILYKVIFQGKDLVEVVFYPEVENDEGDTKPKTELTGTGNSRKVFGTVVKIMQEYVASYKPKALYFTADGDEPSRIKLYNRMISQADKALPDYYASKPLDLGSGTAYMLKKKEKQ